ncbi:MAG: hypothetical protein KDB29_09190 [Planctomycetes bacterium]|nr:hypothetical protein [Planctomycetota bacterium]
MRRPTVFLLLFLMSACGQSAPSPNHTAKKSAPRTAEQPEEPGEANSAHWPAMDAIKAAKTEEEARAGRALYKGTRQQEMLDNVLEHKLGEFDFAQFNKVAAVVKETETPTDAEEAAKAYKGTRHTGELDRVLKAHIKALIDATPSLGLPTRSAGKNAEPSELVELFTDCETESDAESVMQNYTGNATESDLLAAIEVWRWRTPVVVDEVSVSFRFGFSDAFLRFSDGRIAVQQYRGVVNVVSPEGEVQYALDPANIDEVFLIGKSPDEAFVYTGGGSSGMIQKWNANTGELVLAFGSVKVPNIIGRLSVLTPDGSKLLSCSRRGHMSLWDTETGKFIRHIATIPQLEAVRFTGDSGLVFATSREAIRVYETGTANKVHEFPVSGAILRQFGVSRDGKKMAFRRNEPGRTSTDGPPGPGQESLVIADGETGAELGRIPLESAVVSMHWLASGKHVLVSLYPSLLLIDAESMGIVHSHSIKAQPVGSIMSADCMTMTQHIGLMTKDRKVVVPNFFTYGREP